MVLKNFSKLVVVGIDYPESFFVREGNPPDQIRDSFSFIQRAVNTKLSVIQWRIAAYLDNLGYEAMQTWYDIRDLTAHAVKAIQHEIGIQRIERHAFASVITNAPLAVEKSPRD